MNTPQRTPSSKLSSPRKQAHEAVAIAPRVFLHPPGTRPEGLPPDSILLAQHPGAAFGDGSHPTTRLAARAVDLWCRTRAPRSVLDVGTGTGVLARLARAHGARFVAATDIDPIALDAATCNVALDTSEVEILVADTPPDTWGARFDLVVANILEQPLRTLAPALARALAPGGTLLISGFTPLQTPALKATFAGTGLQYRQEARLDGWALLRFSNETAPTDNSLTTG
ncbi:MAG: methyltransferase domain-containing protein [Chitinivibrionales bacterium]|nr:methyltransferase domain-containing protein [Chitinivibrionales bacterium]